MIKNSIVPENKHQNNQENIPTTQPQLVAVKKALVKPNDVPSQAIIRTPRLTLQNTLHVPKLVPSVPPASETNQHNVSALPFDPGNPGNTGKVKLKSESQQISKAEGEFNLGIEENV